jgi:energy-converting hydrogenase Eha subunit H
MENLFRVILIIMCGIGCWGTVVAVDTHQFVMGATAMSISGLMFVVSVKED